MSGFSAKRRWCTVCQQGTHFTADCWGPGTVSLPPQPVYIFTMADAVPSAPNLAKNPVAAAIRGSYV